MSPSIVATPPLIEQGGGAEEKLPQCHDRIHPRIEQRRSFARFVDDVQANVKRIFVGRRIVSQPPCPLTIALP